MNRIFIFVFVILIMSGMTQCAYSYTDDILQGMWVKLERGVVNTLTGFLEIPGQAIKGYEASGDGLDEKILGGLSGLIKGVFDGAGRTVWGVIETAGFWTANPKDNQDIGIPLYSEYAWQKNTIDSSFFNINVADAGRMGNKFLRGAGNTLFGAAEFPGQMSKGFKNKESDLGILKGAWFTLSREYYGISDLLTLFLPSPLENPGYGFEEDNPWDAITGTYN